ncbi:MAG: MFS transporter, partial [Candidatus Geothermarchaeales archaeon]
VLFNLYLLAIGFDIAFIGLRILIAQGASAVASIPAGVVSDRIGRKASFILGDGVGAGVALVNITTVNPLILLVTPIFGSMFGTLHHVTESAFMAENSKRDERIHLFSVSGGTRTLAAVAGAVIAASAAAIIGVLPFVTDIVGAYRLLVGIGIVGWFLSLVPALMLQELRTESKAPKPESGGGSTLGLFGIVRRQVNHPDRIRKLVVANSTTALGATAVIPLLNVFFKRGPLQAGELEIGLIYGVGFAFLALGNFLAPLLTRRMSKVDATFTTRMASVPFILLIPLASQVAGDIVLALTLAGFAYVLRYTLMNISNPIFEAFSMEILDRSERATAVGAEIALSSLLGMIGIYVGSYLMNSGDFFTPFVLMFGMYLVSNLLLLVFFRGMEVQIRATVQPKL